MAQRREMALRLVVCLVLVSCVIALPRQQKGSKGAGGIALRTKRGVLQFGAMILCGTKRNPLLYNGYGCYCGFGGRGTPVDDVDRCCQAHDRCYNKVQDSRVCLFPNSIYTRAYATTSCTTCKPASSYLFFGKCRQELCECDSAAVKCFKRSVFNNIYASYDKKQC